MAITTRTDYFRVNTDTVIADQEAQMDRSIFDLHFEIAGRGVPECIHQRFTADAIYVFVDHRLQSPRLTFHQNSKIHARWSINLLLNPGKREFQIQRLLTCRTKTAYRVSALVD